MATSIFHRNFPGTATLQQKTDIADYIIGLDLHKKTTAICVIDPKQPDQPVFQRKRLKNADLLSRIQSFSGKKIVLAESAYGWFPLRDALSPMEDVTLILLDPRKTSSWIATSGIKNDRIDAQVLCCVCLHGGIGRLAVHQPSRTARERFKLVQYRDKLVQTRTSIKNQLSAIERDYGTNPYTGEVPEKSDLITFMEADLLEALKTTEHRVQSTEKRMALLSKDDDVISRLQTIPGIGPITAFALRWKMEAIDRFEDAAHLSSYFGFGIRQRQSGDQLVKGKITKTGNVLIRKLLIQGAQVIRSRRPDLLSLYFPSLGQEELMKDRKHANKVVTALARKHLTFAFHIWKKEQSFDIDLYRQRRQQASTVIVNAKPVSSQSSVAELECHAVR